jgi:hypothetical protein
VAVLLAGLAAIFFVADDVGGGIVLTALLVLGLASRATIVERQIAGSFAKRRGYLLAVQWIALAAIYVLFTVVMFIAAFEHWTRDRHGRVAVYAIAGMLFLLAREIVRRGEESNRWLAGGEAEAEVGRELEPLRTAGWSVMHDVLLERGGNVDHVVWGPKGAFAIETKSGKFSRRDLNQAAMNAALVKQKLRARWVNAVLCVAEGEPPHRRGVVWVVPRDELRSWLLSRPNEQSGLAPLPNDRSAIDP